MSARCSSFSLPTGTTLVSNAEDLVRRLLDVTACRIRTDEHGALVAVYVTARGNRPATEIVADVVTLLAAEARAEIDPSRVHVTVLPPLPEEAGMMVLEELEHEGRVRLHAIHTSVSDERTRVDVELVLGAASAVGHAEALGAGGVPELTAAAVLDGLDRLCAGRVTLRLLALHRSSDVTSVVVLEADGREARTRVGAARGEDPARAAGYAALSALNRRLGRILASAPKHFRIA
jgi:hypothetical protein